MSNDVRFLQIIMGAIGVKGVLKKSLARKCGISKPYFSEILHGDRPLPLKVKERLIKELNLEGAIRRLNL